MPESDGTLRYSCNCKKLQEFKIASDDLEFGCEFEFYTSEQFEEDLFEDLRSITNANLLVNRKSIPIQDDRHYCMNYKPDNSLTGYCGREISVPICSIEELKHYIIEINKILNEYGSTNEDTGFHIHISTKNKSLDIDFYAFMLLCEEASLLSNWGSRNRYSLNVMDVLGVFDMKEAKELKEKKGRIWSLEKRKENHIEIRTIGGTNYHKQTNKILEELEMFTNIFRRILLQPDIEYKELLKAHKIKLEKISEDKKEDFYKIIGGLKT